MPRPAAPRSACDRDAGIWHEAHGTCPCSVTLPELKQRLELQNLGLERLDLAVARLVWRQRRILGLGLSLAGLRPRRSGGLRKDRSWTSCASSSAMRCWSPALSGLTTRFSNCATFSFCRCRHARGSFVPMGEARISFRQSFPKAPFSVPGKPFLHLRRP